MYKGITKEVWKPTTILNPVPTVMVTCQDDKGKSNIITIAWAGTLNSDPPMLSISIRKSRYSHKIIKDNRQFVVNLTTKSLTYAVDFCGVKSGREIDKFEVLKLTKEKASKIDVPLILESPINIECVVKEIIELGSHDMFISEIVSVNVDKRLIDDNGKLDLGKAGLICYSHGEYWSLHKCLGFFGYSIAKKETLKRRGLDKIKK